MGPNHIDARLGLQCHYGVLAPFGVPHSGGTPNPWGMGYGPYSLGYGVPGNRGMGPAPVPQYLGYGSWANGTTGTAANLAYDYARLATIPVVPVSYVAVWLLSIYA